MHFSCFACSLCFSSEWGNQLEFQILFSNSMAYNASLFVYPESFQNKIEKHTVQYAHGQSVCQLFARSNVELFYSLDE